MSQVFLKTLPLDFELGLNISLARLRFGPGFSFGEVARWADATGFSSRG